MNSKRLFVIMEITLAVLVIVLAFIMVREQSGKERCRVSVILPDADSSQWSAFRYGLKTAAEDQGAEMFVVSTGDKLTLEEEISLIRSEIRNGADAVIVQPAPGDGAGQKLAEISKKVPIMLVGKPQTEKEGDSLLPMTGPDDYAMGKALAEEVLRDFNGNVEGKALGLAAQDMESVQAAERRRGFLDALQGRGTRTSWTVSLAAGDTDGGTLNNQSKTDLVIALDDTSLTEAGERTASRDLHGALLYGIGHSTEAVYFLDTGNAECLVVPDEFSRGYESLSETVEGLENFFHKMESKVLSYTTIRRKELFTKKNQEIIFTMSQ